MLDRRYLPVVVEYGTAQTYTLTTTVATLDATNLKVTFVGPPSGKVQLMFEAFLAMSAADTVFVGWSVGGVDSLVTVCQTAQITGNRIRAARKVTVTPGTSYTALVRGYKSSTSTVTIQTGGTPGIASMTMTPCQ